MVYILIFFIIVLFINYKGRYENNIYWSLSWLLIIIAGFRAPSVSLDYGEYQQLFYSIDSFSYYTIEPIFKWLCLISPNVEIFFLLYAIIAVSLKFYAFKHLSYLPFYSILFYFVHFFLLHEMTQIRIGLASCFILLMIKELCEKKKTNAFFLFLLAVFSHFSSIICFMFFFYDSTKISIKKYALLIILALLIYLLDISVVSCISSFLWGIYKTKLETYYGIMQQGMHDYINVFNVNFLLQLVIVAFLLYLCKRKNILDQYTILLVKVYTTGIILYLCFTEIPSFAFRLSEICFVTEILLLPRLILLFKQKKTVKIGLLIFAFLWLFLNVFILNLVGPYNLNL